MKTIFPFSVFISFMLFGGCINNAQEFKEQASSSHADTSKTEEVLSEEFPLDPSIKLEGAVVDTAQLNRYLKQAKTLSDSIKFRESNQLLKSLLANSSSIKDSSIAKINNQISNNYFKLSKADSTIVYGQKAVHYAEKVFGADNIISAEAWVHIGDGHRKKGDFEEAIASHEKALDIFYQVLGKQHLKAAICLNTLGLDWKENGNREKALEYHQKALEIFLAELGENDLKVASMYLNIGLVLEAEAKADEAKEYYEKSHAIKIGILGENHPKVANSFISLGGICFRNGQYEDAIEYYKKGLKIWSTTEELHPDVTKAYYNLGNAFIRIGELDKAVENHEAAEKIWAKDPSSNNLKIAYSLNSQGVIWKTKGDYVKAIALTKRSIAIRKLKLPDDHPKLGSSYYNLGNLYYQVGDYDNAFLFNSKAYNIWKKSLGEKHPRVAYTHGIFASISYSKENYPKALESYQKQIEIFIDQLGPSHPDLVYPYNNIGSTWFKSNNFDKALEIYKKSLEIGENSFGPNHLQVAESLNNIGVVYFNLKEYEVANDHFNRAIKIRRNIFAQDYHPILSSPFANIAKVAREQKHFHIADSVLQEALLSLNYNKDQPLDFENVPNLPSLRSVFDEITEIYLQQYPLDQQQFSGKIHDHIQRVIALEYLLQNKYSEGTSREVYFKQTLSTFEKIMDFLWKEKTEEGIKKSFQLSEETKSTLLVAKLRDEANIKFSNVPDSLLEKERSLKVDLAYFEKLKYQEEYEKESTNDSLLTIYENNILLLKEEFNSLLSLFEESHPSYYAFKYKHQIISIAGIQDSLLSKNAALVEYFVGDSSIFVFVITSDKITGLQVKKDFPLEDWVRQFRCGIFPAELRDSSECKLLNQVDANAAYVDAAQKIYEKIFAPIEEMLSGSEQVIIVPDGVLGYLPFDALIKKAATNSSQSHLHEYLLNDFDISYAYSATLLQELKYQPHDQTAGQSFIAYAPSFEASSKNQIDSNAIAITPPPLAYTRNEITPLKYSIPEVQAIQAQIGGTIFIDSSATREAFLASASDARILHLSTHGKANDKIGDYSFLAFYQHPDSSENSSRLYNRDLYNLQLNADMVVLSACETGIGELQRGEGIISMARGFSYAGAKSIVTTLWSVNDASSNKLMTTFYRFLSEGKTKDAALKAAKLELMSNPQYASPYHWAGTIPIGDMSAINLRGGWNWRWIALGISFSLIILLLVYRKF